MAINVTVSGGGAIVAEVGGSSSAILSVGGGIGPAAYINGTNTSVIGVHPVYAGANITVSTTSGSYTIIGRDVPVQSIQGRTGNVVLSLMDFGIQPQAGNAGKFLVSDGTNADWYSIVAGANVTVSMNTSAKLVVITSA